MKNRKTRIMIACMAAALAVMPGISFSLASPAQAREEATETAGVSQLSDVEDGYDTCVSDICYEIEAPSF